MKAFGFYKSKKYFQRVLFSITLAMALVLIGLSVVNAYVLERSVRQAQEDSNLKVLTQIRTNLSYMNEIITHLSAFAFRDNALIPLLFSEPLPDMDYIRGYNEMERLMESSSFLHSIAVYNARSDRLYGSSSAFLVDGGATENRIRAWLLHPERPHPTSRLIPVRLGSDDGPVDAFAFVVADAYKPYDGKESALVLYIKTDWVFDGLRRVNGAGNGAPGELYIRTPDGELLSGSERTRDAPSRAAISALVDRKRGASGEDTSSGFVTGNTGRGKSMVTYMDGIGDWTILYVQPYGQLMKDVISARTKSLFASGAFLLLAVGVSVRLSYKLYDPIETMLRRIRPHLGPVRAPGEADGTELDDVGDNVLRLSEKLQEISSEQIVRKYYLRKFLTDGGMFFEDDMRQLIARHELNVSPDGPLTVCTLRIDRFAAYDRAKSAAEKKLYAFAVANIAQELLSAAWRCEVVDMEADHLAVIVSGAGAASGGDEAGKEAGLERGGQRGAGKDGGVETQAGGAGGTGERIRERIRAVQETVGRYYGLSLSAGIADPVPGVPHLSAAYRQACELSLYRFAKGDQAIVSSADVLAGLAGDARSLPPDVGRRLSEALKKGQLTNAGSELEKAFSLLEAFSYEDMRRAVSDLAWAIRGAAADIRSNSLLPQTADAERIAKAAEESETLEDAYVTLLSACARMCEGERPAGPDRGDWIVGTVKELIEQKYRDPNLSQQSIASSVKLTSAYVGKLFKERCGITVTEYMNEVRLGHARRLLLQTDDTIADIMERCGYSNQSYFFRLFKGKFGSTPKDYRLKRSLS